VTVRTRRGYDNSSRLVQAAETRERIVAAGAELLHASSIRDWRAVTIRAVAERAGVAERTIYRHFANERGLRDAVLHHLEAEAGVRLDHLELEGVADAARRIFEHVSSYPPDARPALDPTLSDASRRQHEALRRAVAAEATGWSDDDRVAAAAVLDVLWGLDAYEHLVTAWHLDREDATRAITWAIGLVNAAVRADRRPSA
jgi:AcrR family transcriptional regulator